MTLFFPPRIGHFCLHEKPLQVDILSPQWLCVSGILSSASWSADAAFPVLWTFLKPNFFLKLSNYPLLALNSPALALSPSFCSKLSYNDFPFSWFIKMYRHSFPIAILHPRKSCIFDTRWKGILQKVQGFCLRWSSCSDRFTNFPYCFYNGPYTGFIYLEMAGNL